MESRFSKWLRTWLSDELGLGPQMTEYLRLAILVLILALLCILVRFQALHHQFDPKASETERCQLG